VNIPDVSKDGGTFIFKGQAVNPITQHHIPKHLNPQKGLTS
jgi:hypothetical protein